MVAKQTIHAVIYKDAESDGWLATCLEYHITTQAETAERAKEMVREAVELYLEDAKPEPLELAYQPISGEVIPCELEIEAPPVLKRAG